jgi:hypothetical protein
MQWIARIGPWRQAPVSAVRDLGSGKIGRIGDLDRRFRNVASDAGATSCYHRPFHNGSHRRPKAAPPENSESFMHRFRKLIVLVGVSALALILTIERRGQDVRLTAEPSLSAAVRSDSAGYELAQAQIFSKTLYYVNSQYFDRTRPDPKKMLVGALDFLQRDVPEVLVDRFPERDPKQVTVKVNGEQKIFPSNAWIRHGPCAARSRKSSPSSSRACAPCRPRIGRATWSTSR